MKEGMKKSKTGAAIRQLTRGKLTDEEIAEDFDLTLEEVLHLRKTLEKQKEN